ncbi:hypothetical protein Tco_0762205 [Tanacetum coccineum]
MSRISYSSSSRQSQCQEADLFGLHLQQKTNYVAAASCCTQRDANEKTLIHGFVILVWGKHIEIRHHFIRDANEKNLIQVLKIHTDENVADLLTKAFDGPRFEYLVVHIGMVDIVLVSAGSTMILLVDSFLLIGCMFLLFAWFLLLVDSFCWLNTFMLLKLFMLSMHLFMLLNCFCCAQFDIAGWLVSATSHLVSAGRLQSCWCNNVSAECIVCAAHMLILLLDLFLLVLRVVSDG